MLLRFQPPILQIERLTNSASGWGRIMFFFWWFEIEIKIIIYQFYINVAKFLATTKKIILNISHHFATASSCKYFSWGTTKKFLRIAFFICWYGVHVLSES